MAAHPSPEIRQALVDKIVARRGSVHAFGVIDPSRTALVIVDMDEGSCQREPAQTATIIVQINTISRQLRRLGGVVAFVTSVNETRGTFQKRLGKAATQQYVAETEPGGIGTRLDPKLLVEDGDLHATKKGASAFFPDRCDLHPQLQALEIQSVLIVGLMTNICCESSGRDACELGYEVTLISDANVGQSFGLHQASLSTFFRFFGDVRPTDDVLTLLEAGSKSHVSPPGIA